MYIHTLVHTVCMCVYKDAVECDLEKYVAVPCLGPFKQAPLPSGPLLGPCSLKV